MKKPLHGSSLLCSLLSFFFFFLLSVQVYAITKTSTGNGSWSQNGTWSPAGPPAAGDDVIIAAGHTVVINTDVSGIVSLTINGVLTVGNNNTDRTITVSGNVTINTGGVLNTSGNGGNRLFLTGNLVNNGVFDANLATATMDVTFNGTTLQTVSGSSTPDFNGITLNNNAGVTLAVNADVRSIITFALGILTIQPGVTVHVINGNAMVSGGFSAVEHVNTQVNTTTGAKGVLRVGNIAAGAPYTFHIGNGTYYLPVTITPLTALSNFSVTVYTGITVEGTPNGTPFTSGQKYNIVDAVWDINRNTGSGDADITLFWVNALEGPGFSGLSNAQIGIGRHDGVSWTVASGSGNQGANNATRTNNNAFGPFGVGQNGVVLPVQFANIRAFQKNGGVQVEWSNMTEKDIDHYVVERSADGARFSSIGEIPARSNTESRQDYVLFDAQPAQGSNFYRIRGIEVNNRAAISPVVKVDIGSLLTGISLYPNPVKGSQLSLQLLNRKEGQYTVTIINNNGQQLYRKTLQHLGGSLTETLELPAGIKAGMYSLTVTGDDFRETRSFVIQK